ncbi:MAG: STAS domain-containing protein [Flavobacteriaceae bacterium]|nr:STAS domain-containing protein [Flavobacteriaceae bacterium]
MFEIEGNLASSNSKKLNSHFEFLFNTKSKVVLSLDNLNSIDTSCINCIVNLYKKAAKSNVIFYVIGKTNKKISNAIKKLNYVVKSDFL